MNEEFYKHAKKVLDEMSIDELEVKLLAAGFNVTRKGNMKIEQQVREVVGMQLGYHVTDVENEKRIVEDLGADSLDLVELVMAIEDEFELEISDKDAEPLYTVQQIIDYVSTRLNEAAAEPTSAEADEKFVAYDPQFDREYRLYAFVNYYLSSIQQGIQTGHAAVDMVMKYVDNGNIFNKEISEAKTEMVRTWASSHKTFITLNGGNNQDINKIFELAAKSGYPFCPFHEDEASLGGLMTTVAVVLPDDIFNLQYQKNLAGETYFSWTRELDDGGVIVYNVGKNDPEYEFVKMLKSKGLAK